MHKPVHKSSVPDSYTLLLFITKSLLFKCFCSDMYVCIYVPRAPKNPTTNSLCVCTHLVNKANSDSYIYIYIRGGHRLIFLI